MYSPLMVEKKETLITSKFWHFPTEQGHIVSIRQLVSTGEINRDSDPHLTDYIESFYMKALVIQTWLMWRYIPNIQTDNFY